MEGLTEALAGSHPDLTVLTAHDNPGFGAGCNLGAAAAFLDGAPGVWFLNNDAQVDAPMLEKLLALSSTHPEVAFWGHTQREGQKRLGADHQPGWFALPQRDHSSPPSGCRYLTPQESLSGASLFVSRRQWEEVGAWPTEYFLYYEDAAYCLRAHRLGKALALLDQAVLHDRGTTTGRRSPLTVFYGVRNQLILHREIHPRRRGARLFMGVNLLQKRLFQGRWALLKPTLQGILAAAAGQLGRDPRY